jgi:hypothetical protein
MRVRVDAPRRRPVDWHRYSKQVHRAQRRLPRHEHPIGVSLAASLAFAVAGLWLLQLVGGGIGAGIQQLGSSLMSTLPQARESELVLGETQVNVGGTLMLDGLPEFTKSNAVTISGKVPAFAIGSGRTIELVLNGLTIGTFPIAGDGRFGGTAITLPDGTSTITARLLEGATDVATTSATVFVDRTAPALSITRPKATESIEGPDIIVEGKTEPGADVSVNDRALRPNPDGTFTERLTAVPGTLTLNVVARDKAGNETKTSLAITVKPASQAAVGTTVAVTLDRAKVRPGETVVARVVATENGKPKADLAVTLQVGVITIGTYKTDASGTAIIGFAAPNHEVDDVAIVILGGGTSARATLTVATK